MTTFVLKLEGAEQILQTAKQYEITPHTQDISDPG